MMSFTVFMAHILPHMVQVPSVEGGALSKTARARTGQRQLEHLVPGHAAPRITHAIVAIARAGHAFGDVGGVGGDLRSHQPLAHVVRVRQAQMLGRRHVAEEVGARQKPRWRLRWPP